MDRRMLKISFLNLFVGICPIHVPNEVLFSYKDLTFPVLTFTNKVSCIYIIWG